MNKTPLEKEIEQKVCDYAKKRGCLVYKFTSPSRRSVPDRLFIMPNGKGVFFIEFKRLGEVSAKAQVIEQAKIVDKGTSVYVIDSVQKGIAAVGEMLTAPPKVPCETKKFFDQLKTALAAAEPSTNPDEY